MGKTYTSIIYDKYGTAEQITEYLTGNAFQKLGEFVLISRRQKLTHRETKILTSIC